jgi:hypothetical protein
MLAILLASSLGSGGDVAIVATMIGLGLTMAGVVLKLGQFVQRIEQHGERLKEHGEKHDEHAREIGNLRERLAGIEGGGPYRTPGATGQFPAGK